MGECGNSHWICQVGKLNCGKNVNEFIGLVTMDIALAAVATVG